MSAHRPLLTVVTVVRNASDDIIKTFESIAALKSTDLEYIVLDGGSTDGTIEQIQRFSHIIDYWHSRPDGGIYFAMNEALQYAHGHFVVNMNAGDSLLSIPTEALKTLLATDHDMLCCPVVTDGGFNHFPLWDERIKRFNTVPHQGCFYKLEIFHQHRYDIRYKVFADFDLNQRLFAMGFKAKLNDQVVSFHSLDGVSNNRKYSRETFTIVRRNFGLCGQLSSWLHFKKEGIKARLNRWFGIKINDATKQYHSHA